MSLRVAIAGLHAETNTFSPVLADAERFAETGIVRGDEIPAAFAEAGHTISGFLAACRKAGAEVVPIAYANPWACGAITHEAFEALAGEIVRQLVDRGPFDVVLLPGHGASVSECHDDAEGELAARVRAAVGPGVVIGAGLDLHANLGTRLIAAVDVAVGYRENPHRDPAVRGEECAALALRAARGEIRPVQRLIRLPMVVPILGGWTGGGAMQAVMADAAATAAKHGLLSYSVFHGFGYADVPQMGSSVLAISDRDAPRADRAARELAAALWYRREELRGDALEPQSAVAEADRLACGGGPIALLDVGDNVGGGSPGDSTVLPAHALERGVRGFVATLCDKHAVVGAQEAGLGAEVELEVGRTTAVSAGPRLTVRGRVAHVTDGRFEDRNPTHAGFRFYDAGPSVRISTDEAQEIVLTSRAAPPFSPEQLRSVGIEPRRQRVLLLKGVVGPRAGYEPIVRQFLLVDTPGVTCADLSRLAYERRPRPLWPLDPDVRLGPAPSTLGASR
jgi:microcystin degradation protein MlrC